MTLLPVEEAQARLLAKAQPRAHETVPLTQAPGRTLATDLIAQRDQPAADLSAMDGYAIRFADLPGPWTLAGTSAAGGPLPPPLHTGQATRIFTGAPLPAGADTVIMQEDCESDGTILRLTVPPPAQRGKHVRPRASDFAHGQHLVPAGTPLSPTHIALAALSGHGQVAVHARPRVAILSTGSELVPPGSAVPQGALPASNAVMIAAMLSPLGCIVEDLGIVPDDRAAITAALVCAAQADIILTSGGASVGDHDLIVPALQDAGGHVDFWKIAMRPGKPLICGALGNAVMLGLPGNPVSAFVTAFLFALPLVRAMSGSSSPLPPTQQGILASPLPPGGTRAEYLRGHREGGRITPVVGQDSAATLALSRANCLIVRPAHVPAAVAGDVVTIHPL